MKCFFDSNVVIDALTNREGAVDAERRLLYSATIGEIEGVMSTKQMTDIYYVLRKYIPSNASRRKLISILLQGLTIIGVVEPLLCTALASSITDFENAIILESAKKSGAAFIVTNDVRGFHGGGMDVKTPAEAVSFLGI